MLELQDLARRYGDVVALDGISFTVEAGQMFGFVGPNGAGKTTTMRIVLGVLAPDRGEVLFRGRPVDFETRARFGYMPEERGLYPKMRVRDQLVYFGRLHGIGAAAAVAAANSWIDRLGLTDRAGDRVEQLSLGNQQRVQLAAAMVHDPELLVLDEPFSGLDPVGVDVLSGVLADYAAGGVPVVFSSHQLELVERLCEAVAIIKDGRLVASGRVEELRDRGADGRRVRVKVEGATGEQWLASVPGAEVVSTRPARAAGGAARRRRPGRRARRRAHGRHRDVLQPRAPDAAPTCSARRWRREGAPGGRAGRAAGDPRARAREVVPHLDRDQRGDHRPRDRAVDGHRRRGRRPTSWAMSTRPSSPSSTRPRARARRPTCRSSRGRWARGDVRAEVDDGTLDAAVVGGRVVAKDKPDDELLSLLQAANRQVSAARALEQAGVPEGRAQRILDPQPLKLTTLEPIDPDEDAKAGLTFFIVLILYGQLLTYGYWVAAGVVEEKASRVVEVVLSTIRPAHLLAGKVIGLGLLGLGNLLLIGAIGLGTAAATGRARRRRHGARAPSASRWRGSWSATRSTPARSPVRARSSRARRTSRAR